MYQPPESPSHNSLSIPGVAAKLDHRRIKERTARGRVEARANGVKFGRKAKLTPYQKAEALARRERGDETPAAIARSYSVSRWTIQRL